ncbi:MAG: hypothetical protein HRT38_17820 [Alteromonadaceae bacterium]|nr:hypothetical protein [Alteromonadaceae bacterium]
MLKHLPLTIIFTILILLPLVVLADSQKSDLEIRISNIEEKLTPPNPLAHDIGLRREIEGVVRDHKHVVSDIDKIELELKSLGKEVGEISSPLSPQEIDNIIDTKAANLRSDVYQMIDLMSELHKENLKSINDINKKAIQAANSSANKLISHPL